MHRLQPVHWLKRFYSLGAVQTGALGWRAIARGERPRYASFFPERGLFRVCRQPVYVAFALPK
jgi:hypothetical protein